MEYSTDNFALDGETWIVSIKMVSTFSNQPDEPQYVFDIEFRDSCWDASIQAAEFSNYDYIYDLWQYEVLNFGPMLDLTHDNTVAGGIFCGCYTHELEYVDGPALDPSQPMGTDLTHYSEEDLIDGTKQYEGVVDMFNWIGVHTLRIKSTLGCI